MENIAELREYARRNSVPILRDGGDDFICRYIKEHNIKRILEIGTAIGYSAIRFACCSADVRVTTIEIDIDRVIRAIQNIEDFHLQDRINVIHADALLCSSIKGEFDLIFIDAAKAQYIKFFEKYKLFLADGGVIVSDNLSFHGMVEDLSLTHNDSTIKLVKKIRKYVDFLRKNPEFHTDFYTEGDGISVSYRI